MTRTRIWALAAGAGLLLAGCASGSAPTGPVDWDTTLDLGVPGALIATTDDVEFYPACGNEVLTYEGQQWYPFTPANADDFVAAIEAHAMAPAREALGFARASAVVPAVVPFVVVPAVAAPGPGDDSGTLTRYEGGFAHWESDNGNLETWLTATVIEYRWVC